MNRTIVLVFSAFALFVVACSRNKPDDRVVVFCDNHVLTAGELDARATNIALLFVHKSGNTNRFAKIKDAFVSGYAKYWIEDMVLADAARAAGVEPDPAIVSNCQKQAFANFSAKKDRSYDDLMAIAGLRRDLWESQVHREALRLAMRAHWATEFPANLPPTYADEVTQKILKRNEELVVTNRIQFAKATNVWHRLKAGADFVKTARANTEIAEEIEDDCEWTVVDAKFLADDLELLRWLKQAKPGEFSPPIAADNGVMIARLDRFEEAEGYAVSRIFFHLAEILPPAGKEAIIATALEKYADKLYVDKLGELVERAHVVRTDFEKGKEKQ